MILVFLTSFSMTNSRSIHITANARFVPVYG